MEQHQTVNQAILDALGLGHERQAVGATIRLRPGKLPHVVLHKVIVNSNGIARLREEYKVVKTGLLASSNDKSQS